MEDPSSGSAAIGHSKARTFGRQGPGQRSRKLGWMVPLKSRSWKRRLERSRRRWLWSEERERKEQGSRQEEQRKGSSVGQQSLGVCQQQGQGRGEIIPTLATAVSKESTAATLDWGDILKLCADLNKSGCALAWCLFNAEELYHQYGNSTFKRCFFVMDMELKAGRRRSAFPFCEGDFAATKEVCQKTSLAESVTDTFCLGSCWPVAPATVSGAGRNLFAVAAGARRQSAWC